LLLLLLFIQHATGGVPWIAGGPAQKVSHTHTPHTLFFLPRFRFFGATFAVASSAPSASALGTQHLKRTGWVRHNVSAPECIAGTPLLPVAAREAELGSRREGSTGGGGGTDHMYRMGIMAMLFADSSLNKERMVKLALVHDMAGNPSPPPPPTAIIPFGTPDALTGGGWWWLVFTRTEGTLRFHPAFILP
jgi:hypothetical protein